MNAKRHECKTRVLVSPMKKYFLLSLLCFSTWLQAAELTATVDRSKIFLSDTLNLTIRFSQQNGTGSPDFSLLEQQFDILSNNRSSQYRNINGQVESFTQWQLMLAPKAVGKLLIPSFEFDGAFSDAIAIQVFKEQPVQSDQLRDIFLETELSKEKVFVQEQFLLTVRLHTSVSLQGFDKEELVLADARVEQVAEHKYQRQIHGRTYLVVETVYAVFPQTSGELIIPPKTWTVSKPNRNRNFFDPFNNRGGQIQRLRTQEQRISVLAKPSNYPDVPWLPAEDITLEQSWSNSPDQFRVGEPITRTLTLKAKGLTSAQLPPLPFSDIVGIKVYPDQPQIEDKKNNEGITGVRVESQAIVPTKSGKLVLPAVVVTWWDTLNQRIREVTLPVQEIAVAPSATPTISPPPAVTATDPTVIDTNTTVTVGADNSQIWLWQLSTLLFALLSLGFALLWWQRRSPASDTRPRPNTPSVPTAEKQAYRQLQQALRQTSPQTLQCQDLLKVRQALLHWAQIHTRNPTLTQIGAVAAHADSAELKTQLQALDTAIYGNGKYDKRDMEKLLEQLSAWRRGGQTTTAPGRSALPELYTG